MQGCLIDEEIFHAKAFGRNGKMRAANALFDCRKRQLSVASERIQNVLNRLCNQQTAAIFRALEEAARPLTRLVVFDWGRSKGKQYQKGRSKYERMKKFEKNRKKEKIMTYQCCP
jgi:hypothetical protein